MIGFSEDRRSVNYLAILSEQAQQFSKVSSVTMSEGQKRGAASADIRTSEDTVIVEHDNHRVTIKTTAPAQVVEQVKKFWRQQRGPAIKHKGQIQS